jgi:hypothetical protein
MGDSGESLDRYVRGIVELLPGRLRPRRRGRRSIRGRRIRRWRRRQQAPFRLKEIYHSEEGFPERRFYQEWRLIMDVNELAEKCPKGSTEEKVGERLLGFFHNFTSACQVLWLSDKHFLLCSGPNTRRNLFPFLTSFVWQCAFETEWGRHELSLHSWVAADSISNDNTEQVLRALHRIVALGTHIIETRIYVAPGLSAFGIEDFLSRVGSRRKVWLGVPVTLEVARACSRHVALVVFVSIWRDRGAALAEAMTANQCPRCMELYSLDEESVPLLAVGLRATTSLEELTITIDSSMMVPGNCGLVFDAIGRSGGIRSLTMNVRNVHVRYVDYLEEIVSSTSIRQLDIRGSSMAFFYWLFDSQQPHPRLEADRLARLVRSNRAMVHLAYNPDDFDPETVESRVAPVLRANRARLSIMAMLGGDDVSGTSSRRAASRILESPLVRDHPEPLFLVLQALFEVGVVPPPRVTNFVGG